MKNAKEDQNALLSNFHSLLMTYHIDLSNQLPNPPNLKHLTELNLKELFSSLQLTINNTIEASASNNQLQYETLLRHYEGQIRSQYRSICQMRLQKEAMEKKIHSLYMKEEAYEPSRKSSSMLVQKENEILILRAENSNLKSTMSRIEEEIKQYKRRIEALEKEISEYTINPNNINININDISNSKVIIKANNQFPSSTNKKKKKQINLSESSSNRNVFLGTYRSAFSSNRTTQGSQCQTKGNINHYNNLHSNNSSNNNSHKNSIMEHGTRVNSTSRLWNSIQKDIGKTRKKSSITKYIINSSLQTSHNNSAVKKGTKLNYLRPETFRNYPK